jgi:hypothetical protein
MILDLVALMSVLPPAGLLIILVLYLYAVSDLFRIAFRGEEDEHTE